MLAEALALAGGRFVAPIPAGLARVEMVDEDPALDVLARLADLVEVPDSLPTGAATGRPAELPVEETGFRAVGTNPDDAFRAVTALVL